MGRSSVFFVSAMFALCFCETNKEIMDNALLNEVVDNIISNLGEDPAHDGFSKSFGDLRFLFESYDGSKQWFYWVEKALRHAYLANPEAYLSYWKDYVFSHESYWENTSRTFDSYSAIDPIIKYIPCGIFVVNVFRSKIDKSNRNEDLVNLIKSDYFSKVHHLNIIGGFSSDEDLLFMSRNAPMPNLISLDIGSLYDLSEDCIDTFFGEGAFPSLKTFRFESPERLMMDRLLIADRISSTFPSLENLNFGDYIIDTETFDKITRDNRLHPAIENDILDHLENRAVAYEWDVQAIAENPDPTEEDWDHRQLMLDEMDAYRERLERYRSKYL